MESLAALALCSSPLHLAFVHPKLESPDLGCKQGLRRRPFAVRRSLSGRHLGEEEEDVGIQLVTCNATQTSCNLLVSFGSRQFLKDRQPISLNLKRFRCFKRRKSRASAAATAQKACKGVLDSVVCRYRPKYDGFTRELVRKNHKNKKAELHSSVQCRSHCTCTV